MINLQAPINNLGYGVAGYNILKELYNRDSSVALYPIGRPDSAEDFVVQSAGNIKNLKLNRPHVKIWHQHDLYSFTGKGPSIGFPIFELEEFKLKLVIDNVPLMSTSPSNLAVEINCAPLFTRRSVPPVPGLPT